MPIKSVKMTISKNSTQKLGPLGQEVCSVAHVQTDSQIYIKVNTEDTLSWFQDFFLQPIMKDRSNK